MTIILHKFFLPHAAEEILIQNILIKYGCWLNVLC